MDISTYLKRINYRSSIQLTANTLRALHRAHLLAVPFENLEVHLHRRIVLDEVALYEKIIVNKRRGFCYELNGLFAWLLRGLGFRVTMLNSLIPENHNGCCMDYDHPILLVEMGELWILDVGFGDSYRLPLRLDELGEQMGVGVAYRISPVGDRRWTLHERLENGTWEFNYAFTLQLCHLRDFKDACIHYETSPKSSFTRKRMCTLATPDGHITLTDDRLIVARNCQKEETPIQGEQFFFRALNDYFGFSLMSGDIQ